MKESLNFRKPIVFILLIFFTYISATAQSNTISISVNGIEYDDPSFSLLKESLQKNKNVTAVKTSYDQGTAKISMNYNRAAQNLWDEVPQATKQFFKISTINDNNIVLETKNAVKQNTVIKTNTTTTKIDDDCKNCYFNLCNYDGTRSFQGKIFRQINKDNGTYYYNCDNGVVVEKIIYKNGYGQTTNITNDTILMSNAPLGTIWGLVDDNSTLLGIKTVDYHKYTLLEKKKTMTIDGKTYSDVIVVNYFSRNYVPLFGLSTYVVNRYYAKGIGLIKDEVADPNSMPSNGSHSVSTEKVPEMKGVIDQSLVGLWKANDVGSTLTYTYKFNEDGTYQYYVGTSLMYNDSKCYWRLEGKFINFFCTGWKEVYHQEFFKKNDPATGKRAIVIQFRGAEYRTYISEDTKAPW